MNTYVYVYVSLAWRRVAEGPWQWACAARVVGDEGGWWWLVVISEVGWWGGWLVVIGDW